MRAASIRIALLAVTAMTTGCALGPTPAVPTSAPDTSEAVSAVRHGRYTLVEVGPNDAQRDLLRQIIDIRLPTAAPVTVGDALHIVLLQSGYRLCEEMDETHALYGLPVPAVHHQLGPVTLRDALEVLAGRGWQLEVDDHTRQVCFQPRP
jgi:conjugative transfer region protein (TIGR03748 family)